MASLTGQTVSSTYEGLLKLEDNTAFENGDNVAVTDGLGNPIGISLQKSAGGSNIFITIEAQYLQKGENFVSSSFNLNDFENGTGDDEYLQPTSTLIEALNDFVANLNAGITTVRTLNDMFGNIDFIDGTNTTVVVDPNNKTIKIDAVGGGGGGAVTSVNGDTGDVQVETVYQTVKNDSGAIMYRGTPVHTTGVTQGQQPDVVPADAASNYPADYILNEDINAGASGQAIIVGLIEDVDLTPFGDSASNYSPGDEIWLAAGGGFTTTRPTQANAVQPLGRVLKVNVGGNQISGKIDNLGHANIGEHGLPNLPTNFVWEGNLNGVPQAVNQNTLNVASAANATNAQTAVTAQQAGYADEAADVKIDASGSGTFRVILGDDGQASGAYQRLKSDVANGFTYNTAGDLVSAGAFSATNNVTAGGTLAGVTLDISGNADIDGTLQLGAIGNVENEINQNTSDIAVLQAQVYSGVTTETASLTIDDGNYSTYVGKTILMNSASAMDFELDMTTAPAVGEEIYVVQFGAGAVGVINYQGTVYSTAGTSPSTRAQYSSMVLKHLGSNNWLVIGDIA